MRAEEATAEEDARALLLPALAPLARQQRPAIGLRAGQLDLPHAQTSSASSVSAAATKPTMATSTTDAVA